MSSCLPSLCVIRGQYYWAVWLSVTHNFLHPILLNALGTVVCIVSKLWVDAPQFESQHGQGILLETRSVAHKASYSIATAWFWTFNLLALKLRISGGKTLHPLLDLFCCQMCKKSDLQGFSCAPKLLWFCLLLIQTTGWQATAVQPF